MLRVIMRNSHLIGLFCSFCSFACKVYIKCNFSLRACAAAALKDVAAYFTKEQGQVAVSKRTTETVPLIALKYSDSFLFCSFPFYFHFLSQFSLRLNRLIFTECYVRSSELSQFGLLFITESLCYSFWVGS